MLRQKLKEEVEKIILPKDLLETEVARKWLEKVKEDITELFDRTLEELVGKTESTLEFTKTQAITKYQPEVYYRNSLRQEIMEKWRDK